MKISSSPRTLSQFGRPPQVDPAGGTVANRIARLEKSGTIVGFTVELRTGARTAEVKAWVSIAIEGDRTREFARLLLGDPALTALHDTNGRWDLDARRPSIT